MTEVCNLVDGSYSTNLYMLQKCQVKLPFKKGNLTLIENFLQFNEFIFVTHTSSLNTLYLFPIKTSLFKFKNSFVDQYY